MSYANSGVHDFGDSADILIINFIYNFNKIEMICLKVYHTSICKTRYHPLVACINSSVIMLGS